MQGVAHMELLHMLVPRFCSILSLSIPLSLPCKKRKNDLESSQSTSLSFKQSCIQAILQEQLCVITHLQIHKSKIHLSSEGIHMHSNVIRKSALHANLFRSGHLSERWWPSIYLRRLHEVPMAKHRQTRY